MLDFKARFLIENVEFCFSQYNLFKLLINVLKKYLDWHLLNNYT